MRILRYTGYSLVYLILVVALAVQFPSVAEAEPRPASSQWDGESPAGVLYGVTRIDTDARRLARQDTLTAEQADTLRARARELAEQMRALREEMRESHREHRAVRRQLREDRVRELERFRLSEEQRDSLRALAEQAREQAMFLRERAGELRLSQEQREAIREARERLRADMVRLRQEMQQLHDERGEALREYQESLRVMQGALREALHEILHEETAHGDF